MPIGNISLVHLLPSACVVYDGSLCFHRYLFLNMGGTPVPGSFPGLLSQVLSWGYPSLRSHVLSQKGWYPGLWYHVLSGRYHSPGWGVPYPQPGLIYPRPGQNWLGYPPAGIGVPPSQDRTGFPRDWLRCGWYASCSFLQEDFLVCRSMWIFENARTINDLILFDHQRIYNMIRNLFI